MLTGKQRAYLRGLANGIETIGQIGKDGVTEELTYDVLVVGMGGTGCSAAMSAD